MIAAGGILTAGNGDNTFQIDCGSPTYASQVAVNQTLIFKDTFDSGLITSVSPPAGSQVTVTLGANPLTGITGSGSTGLPMKTAHVVDSQVVFVQTGQIIRYQLQYLNLDPKTTIPCLVRDQGTWGGNTFTPNAPQQTITENVDSFKDYLSVNGRQSWAGWNKAYQDMDAGWTDGILQELTAQLNGVILNGFTSITGNANWFRSIPTLVRIDITTRSATQRTEYSTTPNTSAYKLLTQSLIFMPRHSGLPMD